MKLEHGSLCLFLLLELIKNACKEEKRGEGLKIKERQIGALFHVTYKAETMEICCIYMLSNWQNF